MSELTIRATTEADASGMADLLNDIIRRGGTTAFEDEMSVEDILNKYVCSTKIYCCHVALDDDGQIAGYQSLDRNVKLPADVGDIATFARQDKPVKGTGRALFTHTCDVARMAGLTEINATIRADNVPGLGYYKAMGFVDHSVAKGVPLKDGTPVDRISKRFTV